MKVKFLIFCLLIFACSNTKTESDELVTNKVTKIDPTLVKVIKAKLMPLDYIINTGGKVKSFRAIELKSYSSGVIDQVFVQNGEKLNRGKILAVLIDDQEKLTFERAKINLEEFALKYENELISYGGIDSGRVVSADIIENLKLSSGLKKAELDYRDAELKYKNTVIKSPFSGVLADFTLVEGKFISVGEKIGLLNDDEALGVEVNLLEVDYPLLRKGLGAQIKPLGSNGYDVKGIIYNINPVVDEKSGMVKTMLRITEGRKNVIPGMNVEVLLKIPGKPEIVVPKEAVLIRSGREVVFTYENNLAKWNYVKVGKENGKEIEILEGIQEGVNVIISNNLQLSHDAAVTVETNP